ncbi:MAG: tail fiber protein, partial [Vicinamibacterales bacterium]
PINQNQALFALLGTTYGGNGQTTFALPDLRGRVPIGVGQGAGSSFALGQAGGADAVALAPAHLPAHTHTIDVNTLTATARCSGNPANQRSPVAAVPAMESAGVTATYSSAAPNGTMRSGGVTVGLAALAAGGGLAHPNMQPYLPLVYCIALQGIFPSQN